MSGLVPFLTRINPTGSLQAKALSALEDSVWGKSVRISPLRLGEREAITLEMLVKDEGGTPFKLEHLLIESSVYLNNDATVITPMSSLNKEAFEGKGNSISLTWVPENLPPGEYEALLNQVINSSLDTVLGDKTKHHYNISNGVKMPNARLFGNYVPHNQVLEVAAPQNGGSYTVFVDSKIIADSRSRFLVNTVTGITSNSLPLDTDMYERIALMALNFVTKTKTYLKALATERLEALVEQNVTVSTVDDVREFLTGFGIDSILSAVTSRESDYTRGLFKQYKGDRVVPILIGDYNNEAIGNFLKVSRLANDARDQAPGFIESQNSIQSLLKFSTTFGFTVTGIGCDIVIPPEKVMNANGYSTNVGQVGNNIFGGLGGFAMDLGVEESANPRTLFF